MEVLKKSEIAYLEMKGLDYVEIDASRFLRHEFEWGTEVIAMDLDNGKWQKGMIVSPPQPNMKCSVQCSETGRILRRIESDMATPSGNFLKPLVRIVSCRW